MVASKEAEVYKRLGGEFISSRSSWAGAQPGC